MKAKTLIMLLPFFVIGAAGAQSFWQKKDYKEWTEYECKKLLENSPWSQDYTISSVLIETLQSQSSDRAREQRPQIVYQAQFWSALPIRQAYVRLSQITRNDKLTPDQRKLFDERADKMINTAFPDTIVLRVTYGSNVQVDDRELTFYWKRQTKETLKNTAFLNASGGRKIPLADFVAPAGASREFNLVFPRRYEGQPVIAAGDKSIAVEFVHPAIRSDKESRVLINFKPEKMIAKGEAVY